MSCVNVQYIDGDECIGASLPKINGNFAALSAAVCELSASVPDASVNVFDSPTIDLDWNASTRTLSATTSVVPVGSVMAFPSTTAPSGWIKLNGASLSRSTYSNLWTFAQASGNLVTDTAWYSTSATGSFSQGDGSTTFRLPDFRGEFVRAWDDSRGIDSGRGIGVWQKGSLMAVDNNNFAVWSTSVTGTSEVASRNTLGVDDYSISDYSGASMSAVPRTAGVALKGNSEGTSGTSRPRNIPLLYCIKF
jgi:phage-related tail fiber protein